ncbi:hypothetical protein [Actinocorallia aurea]
MSESERTSSGAPGAPQGRFGEETFAATISPYRPGENDLWDRLGEEWDLVEGLAPETFKVYVRWGDGTDSKSGLISGLCLADGPVTARAIRSIPIGQLELLRRSDTGFPMGLIKAHLKPLRRSDYADPEQFAEQVAHYYLNFSNMSSKPAKEMADHSGVPVTTVRGWIREARLRGKLPPGTKGKAG